MLEFVTVMFLIARFYFILLKNIELSPISSLFCASLKMSRFFFKVKGNGLLFIL